MSESHEEGWTIDRIWPFLVILFGLTFLTFLVSFSPVL